jgi:type II secretory pathway pseudopilin PulG
MKIINRKRVGEAGDTIIEVLLSMAVLAIVAASAYATSTRSFHAGLNAQDRDQALSYAQQQLELLKNADGSSAIGTFQINSSPFCIDPAHPTSRQDIPTSSEGCVPPGTGQNSPYTLSTKYDSSIKTFTTTVKWTSAENRPQQLIVHYKVSNSYVSCTSSQPCGSAQQKSSSTAPPQSGLTISAAPVSPDTSVPYKGKAQVSWQTLNVNSGSCRASGDWAGNKGLSGSEVVNNLKNNPSSFTLVCTGFDNKDISKTATISVAPPPVPTLRLDVGSNSFRSGGSTTLSWSATNIPSNNCVASGSWSGSKAISGSEGTGSLSTGTYTYTLTCQGDANQAQQSQTVNVTAPPQSYFTAYQHAGFDGSWPGWSWGPVGNGSYNIPGDTSSFSVYGRAAVRDVYGHCASFYPGNQWVFYSWVQDYGLVNDAFGSAVVGSDCNGNPY